MSEKTVPSVFERRLAERRALQQKAEAEKQAQELFAEDLIPESSFERTESDTQLDAVLNNIDIITAYNRWCGKMQPKEAAGKTENIMISCPVPGHTDEHPSAWINTDKQTWFCGGCQLGGDKYDIAAGGLGISNYKDGSNFHELRKRMAESSGYSIKTSVGGKVLVTEPTTEEDPEPAASVITITEPDEDDEELIPTISLDWKSLVPEDSFLYEYTNTCSQDDVPEEYHFFNGLVALGFALGRDVQLADDVPVLGNLFICTLGRSGAGKSKSKFHLDNLLKATLPHDWNNPNSKGVRRITAPGSAESLINNFMKPVEDPANPKKIAYYAAVRGLIYYNELSSLTGRANRMGNVLKPQLMEFYDGRPYIATSSMTHGSKEAHDSFASAITTSQPDTLHSLLSKDDTASGFLNRWVFVPGTDKKRFSHGGAEIDITPAVMPLKRIQGWASTFKTNEFVEYSTEADKVWDEFFHSVVLPDQKKGSSTSLLTRTDLTIKKLMLLFSANRRESILSEQSVRDAINCYPYLLGGYGITEAKIGTTNEQQIMDAIKRITKKYWEKNKKPMPRGRLESNLYRMKIQDTEWLKAYTTLIKLGILEESFSKPGAKGQPTKYYRYMGA